MVVLRRTPQKTKSLVLGRIQEALCTCSVHQSQTHPTFLSLDCPSSSKDHFQLRWLPQLAGGGVSSQPPGPWSPQHHQALREAAEGRLQGPWPACLEAEHLVLLSDQAPTRWPLCHLTGAVPKQTALRAFQDPL